MTFGRIIVFLSVTLTMACDEAAHVLGMGVCSEDLAKLRVDPIRAAEDAVGRGDRRLLAVNGYTRWTPGALDYSLRTKYGYRTLENTSDTPDDASCVAYQDAAIAYAERYNGRVLQLVPDPAPNVSLGKLPRDRGGEPDVRRFS